eukprot:CAMPEP_0116889536 /NCGR_PEP_ID=MMETSP0467-20121206/66_1 /TAXON_ID=283647 /ORGANISM="Mesodinium pulex, Strain SPMC105" /LENGTH=75 /DNA_ID=CAMNT_0004556377 /DNA_START=310 /DNA_END=537 /DNA_ORIENTATION=+
MTAHYNKTDGVYSVLTILHIPLSGKRCLFETAFKCLKNDCGIYIEDFYQINQFSEEESLRLSRDIFASDLLKKEA